MEKPLKGSEGAGREGGIGSLVFAISLFLRSVKGGGEVGGCVWYDYVVGERRLRVEGGRGWMDGLVDGLVDGLGGASLWRWVLRVGVLLAGGV